MKDKKKIIVGIIFILVFIVIALIIYSIVIKHKGNNKDGNNYINTTSNNVDKNTKSNIDITFSDNSKVYSINGTDKTVTVTQSFAKVSTVNTEVKNKIQKKLDEISEEEFSDYKKQVEEAISGEYPSINADFLNYVGNLSLKWSFEISRNDGKVISIKNVSSGGLGGVSWDNIKGYSFDVSTGELINQIKTITDNEDIFKKTVNENIEIYFRSNRQKLSLYNEYKAVSEGKIENNNWYLSNDGLTVCYEKYKISPFTFEYTIPYSKINNMLNSKVSK